MAKFNKKDALTVDAVQWTTTNHAEILSLAQGFTLKKVKKIPPGQAKKTDPAISLIDESADEINIEELAFAGNQVIIRTPAGNLEVNPSDWLIKGPAGEFYTAKPDTFTTQYAPAP